MFKRQKTKNKKKKKKKCGGKTTCPQVRKSSEKTYTNGQVSTGFHLIYLLNRIEKQKFIWLPETFISEFL